MAISSDSYGTVAHVSAMCRQYLEGYDTFNSLTAVTLSQVEVWIDQISGVLNTAIAGKGFAIPVTSAAATRACSAWVVQRVALLVDATYNLTTLFDVLGTIDKEAAAFADLFAQGLGAIGETTTGANTSEAIVFTGQDAQSERADPDDTSLAQPFFKRNEFRNNG